MTSYYTIQYFDPNLYIKLTFGLFTSNSNIRVPNVNKKYYSIVPASIDDIRYRMDVLNQQPNIDRMQSEVESYTNLIDEMAFERKFDRMSFKR